MANFNEKVTVHFSPSSCKRAAGKKTGGFFAKFCGGKSKTPSIVMSQGSLAGTSFLSEAQVKELIDKIQETVDEQIEIEEALAELIENEEALAKARWSNGSENGALIALKKAISLKRERRRITAAIDAGMEAIWDIEAKLNRAVQKAKRSKNKDCLVNIGSHANVLQDIEEILAETDEESEDNEDLVGQLRRL